MILSRTVVWEFPSYEKAIECHNSKEYLAGWDIAKDTTCKTYAGNRRI